MDPLQRSISVLRHSTCPLLCAQKLLYAGGAQMIVAEVIMGSLLAHYFVGGAAVPQNVGIGILVVVCVFVSGCVFCSRLASLVI